MMHWDWMIYPVTAAVGVLIFLRVVANEIALKEREVDDRHRTEAVQKPAAADQEPNAARAA